MRTTKFLQTDLSQDETNNPNLIESYVAPRSSDNKKSTATLIKNSLYNVGQSIVSSFFTMSSYKHPIKNTPISDYEVVKKNKKNSFHETDQIVKKKTTKANNPIRFFKHNPRNSLMSKLEAIGAAFFRLIAPNHAPPARAHFDANNEYIGVSSKGIPGFKDLEEDPLLEEDLKIDCLEKGYYSIPELDEIDILLEQDKCQLDKMNDDQPVYEKFIEEGNLNKKVIVTAKDIRNYRIVKGQAIGLTTSYILEEGDLHRRNISKFGQRIDFDMLLWTLLSQYKEGRMIDQVYRLPNEHTFVVTQYDIEHFPNIKHADPWYWPPKESKIKSLTDSTRSLIPDISKNEYTREDIKVFQKLETHPVFIYHKFATLLKFILTEEKMYRYLAELYANEFDGLENKSSEVKLIIDLFSNHLANRIAVFKKELLNMPQFYHFLNKVDEKKNMKYSDINFGNICRDFKEKNEKLLKKTDIYPEYQKRVISIEDLKQKYEVILKEATLMHDQNYINPIINEFEVIDGNDELENDHKKITLVK